MSLERILVTGGGGLLAHALREVCPDPSRMHFCSRTDLEIANPRAVADKLAEIQPSIVINTAAYNLVEQCEVERDLSWQVNAVAPQILAEHCAQHGIKLVHFGTDYVFDGLKSSPYVESDPPHPLNHYGAGKLAGEQAVLRTSPLHLVLRTSWIFGFHPVQSKTFVHSVLKQAREGRPLHSTSDQVSVPTHAEDLAQWTLELIQHGAVGLIHAVSDEPVSRYDWTMTILGMALESGLVPEVPRVIPVHTSFFESKMRRPTYSPLSNSQARRILGRPLGSWRAGLQKMLARQSSRSVASGAS